MMTAANLRQRLRIHPTSNLRPPKVNSPHKRHQRATDHDVVEVSDNKVGLCELDIHSQGC
jgi:hypothetical protein